MKKLSVIAILFALLTVMSVNAKSADNNGTKIWTLWDIPGMRECPERYAVGSDEFGNCLDEVLGTARQRADQAMAAADEALHECEPAGTTPAAKLKEIDCRIAIFHEHLEPAALYPDVLRYGAQTRRDAIAEWRDGKITQKRVEEISEKAKYDMDTIINERDKRFWRDLSQYGSRQPTEEDLLEYLKQMDKGLEQVCAEYGRLPGFAADCWPYMQ